MIIDKGLKIIIMKCRIDTIHNAESLLKNAINLFESKQFHLSCFLAMTSIEEAGKLFFLQLLQRDILKIFGDADEKSSEVNEKELNKFLRNHLDKAVQAATSTLYINSSADKRHGINPQNGFIRTSGIIILARSGKWMEIRNQCLYTDINFSSKLSMFPQKNITIEHSYYFICMCHEILAELSEAGLGSIFELGNCMEAEHFRADIMNSLTIFMNKYQRINVDTLDFIKNADIILKEINSSMT